MSGPPKKPTAILKLHNSRLVPTRKNEPEPEIYKDLPRMPAELNADGKRFYKKMGKRLMTMQLLSPLDLEYFVLMCEEYEDYRMARKFCKEQNQQLIKTSFGNIIQNPAIGLRNKTRSELKKTFQQFGLSPSSRASISIEKPKTDDDQFAELEKGLSTRGRKKIS